MPGKPKVDLYELLRVEKTVTPSDLRKAYLALARVCHPDKSKPADREKATADVQALQRAYGILADPAQRERYDRTGALPEDESEGFRSAYERYRGVKVTKEDIAAAEKEFRESEEERVELDRFFDRRGGDVTNILMYIMLSRDTDTARFVSYYEEGIRSGKFTDAKAVAKFHETKTKIKRLSNVDKETDEAESLGDDDDDEEEEEEEGDDDDFIDPEEHQEKRGKPKYSIEANDSSCESGGEEEEERATARKYKMGDEVLVRWRGGKVWYYAQITGMSETGAYSVVYHDGGEKEEGIPSRLIKANPEWKKTTATTTTATTKKKTTKKKKKDDAQAALRDAILKRNAGRTSGFEAFENKWRKIQEEEEEKGTTTTKNKTKKKR